MYHYVAAQSSFITVQVRDTHAGFSSQNGDRLCGVYYGRASTCCAFSILWAKRLSAKDIHKDMFPVYGVKCLLRKGFENWVAKRDKHFAYDEEVETDVQKWLT
jgi:hypothetical protein